MKDEEMAEEYKADYGIDLCCLCRECEVENIKPCQHKKDAMYGYKDGFLAGLKAGRPQWHDLEKDPSDLPKKELWNKQLLLLVDRNGLSPCFVVGYYEESEVLEDYEKNWGWYNIAENVAFEFIDNEISVLKWKEIEK